MHFKKALSVFLAVLMLFSMMSLGLTAAAAEIDYNTQYGMLADALKNEHVRELTNYKVVNKTLENATEGFDPEAKGFAYDHTVYAQDNQTSDILRASNRFYYIAESLMSFEHGVGCYDAATLISYITEKLKPHFLAEDGGVLYEDFFGNRYYPTDEEIAAYNEAVKKITEAGLEIDKITLPEYGLQFIEKDYWDYYNVETVLRYFMGNSVSVNAGNYYHRFSFVVDTSINVFFEDCEGIEDIGDAKLTLRTGAYQFAYQKFYNESTSKSYYAFAEPSLQRVWDSYGSEYGFATTSEDLTKNDSNGDFGVTRGGQASAYLIKTSVDTTTVPYLQAAYSAFRSFLVQEYSNISYIKWDEAFTGMTDDEIDNPYTVVQKMGFNPDAENQRIFRNRIQNVKNYGNQIFSDTYSNKALVSLFGNDLGNMITLHYLFKKTSESPTRVVRGNATYTASPEKIDKVIYSLDALVSPRDGEAGNDIKIANRVTTVLKNFLDVGSLLGTSEPLEYDTLEELVGQVLQSLVFSDSIVNMLVELLYPMIVNLLVDNIGSISVVGGTLLSMIDSILKNNELAIYPDDLADRIRDDYGDKYSYACQLLDNAGDDWTKVNFEAMSWGVDDAPADKKADVFLDALCAGLGGFTRLLICFLCGDNEYADSGRDSYGNFGKWYDMQLIGGTWITSQGLYTKVFVPLYRVLGVDEAYYLDSGEFHDAVDANFRNCLRNAVEPLIKWITGQVAKKPFQTIMALLPNLVHFLSRQGTGEYLNYRDDWHGKAFVVLTDNQENAHKGWSTLQTENLYTILDNIFITISIGGSIPVDLGSLKSLIGDSTFGMLKSINSLLNELISFAYDTDEVDHENIVAYSSNDGTIVLPDSKEYGLNPGNYPNAHFVYYSDVSNTKFSLVQDEEHPYEHKNITYIQKDYYIPAIPEGKLISVGPIRTDWNTINVEHPGKVFIFLLRYVLSALGYKYTIYDDSLPTLIECLGIDLESELFLGLTLGDIIYNVMLHPDEALCALLELFQSGEVGDYFKRIPYTYSMEPIEYHETTLLNKTINPTLTYGSDVKYSQYWTKENADDFIASLTPLAEDVLGMLGLEGFEGGLGDFLESMINDMLFTNDLVNTVFNLIYQLLGGLNDSIGFDIEAILEAVLDVRFKPADVAASLNRMIGHETPASAKIASISSWAELFTVGYEVDPVTGESTPVVGDVDLDWGIDTAEEHGHNRGDSFLKTLAALLAPASFLIKFLFMDQDLSILGLINLPGYAGYQYAFIGLLEALSCPNILTYDDYYRASLDPVCGDANTIYYLFTPILALLEKAYTDPLNVVLSLIPNLLFFISIGGFNGLVNNLVHFAYVLLDILKPILNGYDLVSGLLANLDIAGLSLNLSLPLDIDFNALVSDLLGSLLGDTLTIEGVSIKIPYIDLYTLCVGTLERFNSKEVRQTVFLNATGGGDLLTAILRVVLEVLYMDENHVALSQIIANLAEEGRLDAYDEETLYLVLHGLIGLIEEYEVIDIILFAVYKLITILVPIADVLGERLAANDMTITELIDSAGDQDQFVENLGNLLEDPNKVDPPGQADDGEVIFSLLDRIKMFFEKIKLFFQSLFSF